MRGALIFHSFFETLCKYKMLIFSHDGDHKHVVMHMFIANTDMKSLSTINVSENCSLMITR